MQTIKLTITSDYVEHWSWWEGVRELMQNAIDCGEGRYHIDFLRNSIIITSQGGKIPTSALLMGKSSKRDDPDSIGHFGEGAKLGFLVLLREGATITIQNGSDLWQPAMEYNEIFQEETLVVHITENAFPYSEDVKVTINGIPSDVVGEIEDKYAPSQGRVVVIENERGKAYKKLEQYVDWNETAPEDEYSDVYVNGLFVTRVEGDGSYKFDYDFKPSVLQLDRDRNSVGTWEFEYETSRLLAESDDVELLARLAIENYRDLSKFSERRPVGGGYWSSRGKSEQDILKETATRLFQEKNGDKAFPISQDWTQSRQRLVTESVVKQGYTPVFVASSLFNMIKDNYNVDKKIESILVFQPLPWLEAFLAKHKRRLDAKPRKEIERTIHLLKVAKGE